MIDVRFVRKIAENESAFELWLNGKPDPEPEDVTYVPHRFPMWGPLLSICWYERRPAVRTGDAV